MQSDSHRPCPWWGRHTERRRRRPRRRIIRESSPLYLACGNPHDSGKVRLKQCEPVAEPLAETAGGSGTLGQTRDNRRVRHRLRRQLRRGLTSTFAAAEADSGLGSRSAGAAPRPRYGPQSARPGRDPLSKGFGVSINRGTTSPAASADFRQCSSRVLGRRRGVPRDSEERPTSSAQPESNAGTRPRRPEGPDLRVLPRSPQGFRVRARGAHVVEHVAQEPGMGEAYDAEPMHGDGHMGLSSSLRGRRTSTRTGSLPWLKPSRM
jgi:hypothetical protein